MCQPETEPTIGYLFSDEQVGQEKFYEANIEAEAITIPDDEVAFAWGESLVNTICTGCHAPDLSGESLNLEVK